MKKLPSPKLQVVEADHEAREILAEMLEHHEELADGTVIELMWTLTPRFSKGKRVLGSCKVMSEEAYRLSGVNVLIKLDRDWWDAVPATEQNAKRYLMDHELSHARARMMEVETTTGDTKLIPACDTGTPPRYLYESVPHEIEDFAGPVARWGTQPDLEQFLRSAQLSLPLDDERRGLRAVG